MYTRHDAKSVSNFNKELISIIFDLNIGREIAPNARCRICIKTYQRMGIIEIADCVTDAKQTLETYRYIHCNE